MVVASAPEAFDLMLKYAHKKTHLRYDRLILQSIMAGLWVAVYGHACTAFCKSLVGLASTWKQLLLRCLLLSRYVCFQLFLILGVHAVVFCLLASLFYVVNSEWSVGICKLAYGTLFPGAFVAVAYTGTELFTGNTTAMMMFVLTATKGKRIQSILQLLRVWFFSLVFNFTGAVFGAFLLSYLSGVFHSPGPAQSYLILTAESKINRSFGSNLVLAIGCNMLVCLATWCTVCTSDGGGKILGMWFTVGVFCMGGYEHIVANFYTLSAACFSGALKYTYVDAIVKNFVPVFIGNVLAGTLFTGTIWWYNFNHQELFDFLEPKCNKCDYCNKESIEAIKYRAKTGKGILASQHPSTPTDQSIELV